jgi:Carboxypeptidase regulatory-like domain
LTREAILAVLIAVCCSGATISGTVVDAHGGEPLARVRARLAASAFEATTGAEGRFSIPAIPAGAYVLQIETVGYRLAKHPFTIGEDQSLQFDIALSPETFQRTDQVDVTAGPFEVAAESSPAALNLNGAEIKNLSTVLMNDPMRAVHAMPGVAANNDYQSRFSVRGTGFDRIGLYVDDVLMHAPFHAAGGNEGDASISTINGETVSEMVLLPMNAPPRYSDRTGGILQIYTRDGSRNRIGVRATAGVADAGILAEGPIGGGRGSWIVSARKSYVQYLLNRLSSDSALGIGFTDLQGKVVYSLTGRQSVSLYMLDGTTGIDRSSARDRSGVNALIDGSTRSTAAKANWQFTAAPNLVLSATGAYLRDRYNTNNPYEQPLDLDSYSEWSGSVRSTWEWATHSRLEAGWSARRMRDDGSTFTYLNHPGSLRQFDTHRGTALRQGGYFEQTWRDRGGRVRASAGLRLDAHEFYDAVAASPQASIAIRLPESSELQLAWGQYVQYRELSLLTSPRGGWRLLPERANHFSAALNKRFGDNARIRFEAWNRDDRDLLAQPLFEVRLLNGLVVIPADARYFSSVRGYSRGAQIMLQRRTANRLSGWVSYTLSYARQNDGLDRSSFWALNDQPISPTCISATG